MAVDNNEFILGIICVGSENHWDHKNHWKSTLIIFIWRLYVDKLKCINSQWAALSREVTERTAAKLRQRLHSCFRARSHAVIQMMWCDRHDCLRDNNCYSCLSLFGWSFLRWCMRYPVWTHCYKWPSDDFWISQGNVATVLRWGGQNYSQVSSWCCVPKIIKIGQCFTELFKNKSGTFFLRHSVYEVCIQGVCFFIAHLIRSQHMALYKCVFIDCPWLVVLSAVL